MKYLFIDTATSNLVVALIIDGNLKYYYNKQTGKEMSEKIIPVINEALEKANINANQISKIFAVNGPGSFTGIRVGLTVAKTMAWSLKIPVIPISSLEVIASATPFAENIALIDARRGYVYAGKYDDNLNALIQDSYIPLNSLETKYKFISYDNIENSIKPEIDIIKVIKKHENETGINPHKLNPKYLKLTEAEEKVNKEYD